MESQESSEILIEEKDDTVIKEQKVNRLSIQDEEDGLSDNEDSEADKVINDIRKQSVKEDKAKESKLTDLMKDGLRKQVTNSFMHSRL